MSPLWCIENKEFLHEFGIGFAIKLKILQLLVRVNTKLISLMPQVYQLLQVPHWLFEEHDWWELPDEVLADHYHWDFGVFIKFRVVHGQGDHLLVVDDRCELWPSHEGSLMLDCEKIPFSCLKLTNRHTIALSVYINR